MKYVLDACALIAYLNEERGEGYEAADALFNRAKRGEIALSMNIFNLAEVYYNFIRDSGIKTANEIMLPVPFFPIKIISTITMEVYREASRFKGTYRPLSLADAFLCGTAKSLGAVIVTKDGEIQKPEQSGEVSVLWINR